jgi:hypothetical protein
LRLRCWRGRGATPPVAAGRAGAGRAGAAPAAAAADVEVQVSTDGKTWTAPPAAVQPGPLTTVALNQPVRTKFVRITRTATTEGPSWTLMNVRLFQAAAPAARR